MASPSTDERSEEFFDAISVASEDQFAPDVLAACQMHRGGAVGSTAVPGSQHISDELLLRLLATEQRCRGKVKGVEVLIDTPSHRYTVEHLQNSSEILTCFEGFMPGISPETLVSSITDVSRRMSWDAGSFLAYEKLPSLSKNPQHHEEILYLKLACPRIIGNRDLLQKCWQRGLPGGGWAMIFQSFEDDIRPVQPDLVRARTRLSGYLLREEVRNGVQGCELTNINGLDFGGNMPSWLQNKARKLMKNRPIQWMTNLEKYCRENPIEPDSPAALAIQAIRKDWTGPAPNLTQSVLSLCCRRDSWEARRDGRPSVLQKAPSLQLQAGGRGSLEFRSVVLTDPGGVSDGVTHASSSSLAPSKDSVARRGVEMQKVTSAPLSFSEEGEGHRSERRQSEEHPSESMLQQVLAIQRLCRGESTDAGYLGEVQHLAKSKRQSFSAIVNAASQEVITCLESRMTGVVGQDLINAVTDPAVRLTWDTTIDTFERLVPPDPEDARKEEVILLGLPCPLPLASRELLQRAWQHWLPDGTWVMLFVSFEDDELRPVTRGRVRAFAKLAGYVLVPRGPDEYDFTIINNLQFGGSVPVWLASRVQKILRNKPIEWLKSLEKFARQTRRAREARTGAGASYTSRSSSGTTLVLA